MFLDESGVTFTPAGAAHLGTPRPHADPAVPLAALGKAANGRDVLLPARRRPRAVGVPPPAGSYNDQVLIGVLGQLRRFLRGQKVTLLWDGLPSYRSRIMQAFVVSQRGWLR